MQPLLWALVGAATAGGLFFLVNQPQGASITILLPTPTATPSAVSRDVTPTPQRYLVDINTAPVELLDTLPGIGEKRAADIVVYRTQNGPFRRTDELMKVPGIGPSIYQGLKDLVTVGSTP